MAGTGGRRLTVFVQRWSSALQLNVHLHVLVRRRLFDEEEAFRSLPAPADDEVPGFAEQAARRVTRALEGERIPPGSLEAPR